MGKGKEQKNVLTVLFFLFGFLMMIYWALTSEPKNDDFFNLKDLKKTETILKKE